MGIRTDSQIIGDIGEMLVCYKILKTRQWVARLQQVDYGIDIEAELAENNIVKGELIKIQVKSSNSIEYDGNFIKFRLDKRYLRKLANYFVPVILVIVDLSKEEAYYLFLQEWFELNKQKLELNNDYYKSLEIKLHKSKTLEYGLNDSIKVIARKETEVQTLLDLRATVKNTKDPKLKNKLQDLIDSFDLTTRNVSLYHDYSRNDLISLFDADVKEGSWREGVTRVDENYLLFVNLADYPDYFIDDLHFQWQSQNMTSHLSFRGQEFIHHVKNGTHIHLFVRKYSQLIGKIVPFTYLGELDYVSSDGDKPMNILWRLHKPLPKHLINEFCK